MMFRYFFYFELKKKYLFRSFKILYNTPYSNYYSRKAVEQLKASAGSSRVSDPLNSNAFLGTQDPRSRQVARLCLCICVHLCFCVCVCLFACLVVSSPSEPPGRPTCRTLNYYRYIFWWTSLYVLTSLPSFLLFSPTFLNLFFTTIFFFCC